MAKQLFWEDIEVNNEIPPLSKVASSMTLVKFAGAYGDFNPLHYENGFATSQGVGRPILHGQLKRAWLVQLLTDWMGDGGLIKKFSCQFRGMDYPRLMKSGFLPQEGETWQCKGRVTKKYIENDAHLIDCDIWLENGKGEKTTVGNATVYLPSC